MGLGLGEVETEGLKMLADGCCVVPQALVQAGVALNEVECRGGGCTGVGRHCGGVDVRCRAVANEVDEILAAADKTAGCTEGFAARGHEDVDSFGGKAKVFEGAAAIGTEDAGCVGVIDHEDGVVLFGEGDEFGQWGDVSVHGEDAIGDDEATAMDGRGFELGFEVCGVAVVVDGDLCAGQAAAVDDAAVV